MKCECGQLLTEEEIKVNENIAIETKTKNMQLCQKCWLVFCAHAITGE